MRSALKRVIVAAELVQITFDRLAFAATLDLPSPTKLGESTVEFIVDVPVRVKKGGRPGKILISELALDRSAAAINPSLVKAVVKAHIWDDQIRNGMSMRDIAAKEKVDRSYIGQIVPLAYLAPDITEAILDGRQPHDLKVEELLSRLPVNWDDQRKQFGFR